MRGRADARRGVALVFGVLALGTVAGAQERETKERRKSSSEARVHGAEV